MAQRQTSTTPDFDKDLRRLGKKYHDIEQKVGDKLKALAASALPDGDRLIGVQGQPVYKVRVACGNKGKSGGARLIYYYGDALVMGLIVFMKNDREDVPRQEVVAALKAAGLLPDQPDPVV